ncbi:unnamed protein product [Amoebophrya sp. A120]|nr:unnamed protein product [Amoebophrya sp. A120]|eukprot:GSA120T00023590001.1
MAGSSRPAGGNNSNSLFEGRERDGPAGSSAAYGNPNQIPLRSNHTDRRDPGNPNHIPIGNNFHNDSGHHQSQSYNSGTVGRRCWNNESSFSSERNDNNRAGQHGQLHGGGSTSGYYGDRDRNPRNDSQHQHHPPGGGRMGMNNDYDRNFQRGKGNYHSQADRNNHMVDHRSQTHNNFGGRNDKDRGGAGGQKGGGGFAYGNRDHGNRDYSKRDDRRNDYDSQKRDHFYNNNSGRDGGPRDNNHEQNRRYNNSDRSDNYHHQQQHDKNNQKKGGDRSEKENLNENQSQLYSNSVSFSDLKGMNSNQRYSQQHMNNYNYSSGGGPRRNNYMSNQHHRSASNFSSPAEDLHQGGPAASHPREDGSRSQQQSLHQHSRNYSKSSHSLSDQRGVLPPPPGVGQNSVLPPPRGKMNNGRKPSNPAVPFQRERNGNAAPFQRERQRERTFQQQQEQHRKPQEQTAPQAHQTTSRRPFRLPQVVQQPEAGAGGPQPSSRPFRLPQVVQQPEAGGEQPSSSTTGAPAKAFRLPELPMEAAADVVGAPVVPSSSDEHAQAAGPEQDAQGQRDVELQESASDLLDQEGNGQHLDDRSPTASSSGDDGEMSNPYGIKEEQLPDDSGSRRKSSMLQDKERRPSQEQEPAVPAGQNNNSSLDHFNGTAPFDVFAAAENNVDPFQTQQLFLPNSQGGVHLSQAVLNARSSQDAVANGLHVAKNAAASQANIIPGGSGAAQAAAATTQSQFDPYSTQVFVDDNFSQMYDLAPPGVLNSLNDSAVVPPPASADPFAAGGQSTLLHHSADNFGSLSPLPGTTTSQPGAGAAAATKDEVDQPAGAGGTTATGPQHQNLPTYNGPTLDSSQFDPSYLQTQMLFLGNDDPYYGLDPHAQSTQIAVTAALNETEPEEKIHPVDLDNMDLEQLGPWSRRIRDRFGRFYCFQEDEEQAVDAEDLLFGANNPSSSSSNKPTVVVQRYTKRRRPAFELKALALPKAATASEENLHENSLLHNMSSSARRRSDDDVNLTVEDRPMVSQEQMTSNSFFARQWNGKMKQIVGKYAKDLSKELAGASDTGPVVGGKKDKNGSSTVDGVGNNSNTMSLADRLRHSHAKHYLPYFSFTRPAEQEFLNTMKRDKELLERIGATFVLDSNEELKLMANMTKKMNTAGQSTGINAGSAALFGGSTTSTSNTTQSLQLLQQPQITHLVLPDEYNPETSLKPEEDVKFLAYLMQISLLPGIVSLKYLKQAVEQKFWPAPDTLLFPLPVEARRAIADARDDCNFLGRRFSSVYCFPSIPQSKRFSLLIQAAGSKYRATRPKIVFPSNKAGGGAPNSGVGGGGAILPEPLLDVEDGLERTVVGTKIGSAVVSATTATTLLSSNKRPAPSGSATSKLLQKNKPPTLEDDPIEEVFTELEDENNQDEQQLVPVSQGGRAATGTKRRRLLGAGSSGGGLNNISGATPFSAQNSKKQAKNADTQKSLFCGTQPGDEMLPIVSKENGAEEQEDLMENNTKKNAATKMGKKMVAAVPIKTTNTTNLPDSGANIHDVLWIGTKDDYKVFVEAYEKQFNVKMNTSGMVNSKRNNRNSLGTGGDLNGKNKQDTIDADRLPPICDVKLLYDMAFASKGSLAELIEAHRFSVADLIRA